ncbi:MAG: alkaline phosphatase family protein [Dehalococcoidia bacterium]
MTSPTRTKAKSGGRALLIVIDGLGFNPARASAVVDDAWDSLGERDRALLVSQAGSVLERHQSSGLTPEALARLELYPVHAETLGSEVPFDEAVERIAALRSMSSASSGTPLESHIAEAVRAAARKHRYVPWAAEASRSQRMRNQNLTIPTSAAGQWAGYEELDPPVQGNSETGHQQIGNLTLAPQIPLEITQSIDNGRFFQNEALRGTVEKAVAEGRAINFCILLSGVGGGDGRVHSAWNHLEAFLELIFTHCGADPANVRMQAITDGRDSPPTASIEEIDGIGGYMNRLEALLKHYDATGCLAWVAGRSLAMDRDFREQSSKADFLLMTRGEGTRVQGFDGVRQAIKEAHASGLTDQDIPPLAVMDSRQQTKVIEAGQSFIDLNFRSDRQRAKIAALSGARDLLEKEAASRGQTWTFDWLAQLNLDICTIAEYHPDFEKKYRVKVAFPTKPQRANFLAAWPRLLSDKQYLLVAESVKASHMGYFIRGRREEPAGAAVEERWIVPSQGEAEGIRSDTDFYRAPGMRSREVAHHVVERLGQRKQRLVCANLAPTDMVGHILPDRFDAAVEAYEAVDKAVAKMVQAARSNGYSVVVTADHGNVEDDTSSHSVNDILTTVISTNGEFSPAPREVFQARLFDISWTIATILGVESETRERLEKLDAGETPDRFLGHSIISADG